jgi:gluconokinase
MANVPGLRSPYVKVGRLVYFGRMIDKIHLHAARKLPPDYVANYGDQQPTVFDARCCRFLGVSHGALVDQVATGKNEEALLAWCQQTGGEHTDEQCDIWNNFMMKRGWRDEAGERLQFRLREAGLQNRTDILTFFDFIEVDEGRDPAATRPLAAK